MDKKELLAKLEKEVREIPEIDRNKFFGRVFTSIISTLSKRLIKYEGYSVTNTILQREITEIGRRDARDIIRIFGLKEKTPYNVSQALKIAALLLGYRLEVEDNETVVKECPFAMMAKEHKEPLITQICTWYCNGIAQEILGGEYVWEGVHDISKEVPICFFKRFKKV
jgi:hypothetical protein